MYSEFSFNNQNIGDKKYIVYVVEDNNSVDNVEVRMLKDNHIKGLLTYSDMRNDDEIVMMYDVTGKMQLNHFFAGIVRKEDLITVIESMLAALEEVEYYMLDIDHFVLNMERIYIDINTRKSELVFMPYNSETNKFFITWRDFFNNMLNNTTFDTREDLSYIGTLKALLSDENVRIVDIKNRMGELAQDAISVNQLQTPSVEPIAEKKKEPAPQQQIEQPQFVEEPVNNVSNNFVLDNTFEKFNFGSSSNKAGNVQGTPQSQKTPQNISVPGNQDNVNNLGSIPSIPPVSADNVQSETKKSGGLLGDLFVKKPKEPKVKKEKALKAPKAPKMPKASKPAPAPKNFAPKRSNVFGNVPGSGNEPKTPTPQMRVPRSDNKQSVGGLGGLGGIISKKSATPETAIQDIGKTILDDEEKFEPFIMEMSSKRVIKITGTEFRIGRLADKNDYAINNPRVSGEHAIIVLDEIGHKAYIRDVGSSNGTFVDGERISNNINVRLEQGMTFRIGKNGEEYMYRE